MATFVVHRAGSGRQDGYDAETHYWTIEAGGTVVVHERGDFPGGSRKVAAYAPTWWYLVETKDADPS